MDQHGLLGWSRDGKGRGADQERGSAAGSPESLCAAGVFGVDRRGQCIDGVADLGLRPVLVSRRNRFCDGAPDQFGPHSEEERFARMGLNWGTPETHRDQRKGHSFSCERPLGRRVPGTAFFIGQSLHPSRRCEESRYLATLGDTVSNRVSADAVGRRGRFPEGRYPSQIEIGAPPENAPSGGGRQSLSIR